VKTSLLNQIGALDVVDEPRMAILAHEELCLSMCDEEITLNMDRGGIEIALITLVRGRSLDDRVQLSKQSSGGVARV
jgi:hypothetical protein